MDRADRFVAKVLINERSCWIWQGGCDPDGYGIFFDEGKSQRVHRWAYQQVYGALSPGAILDHLVCSTPSCCNPNHLAPSTQRENLLRGNTLNAANHAKTRCLRGHAYDEKNTYLSRAGKRVCRLCQRDRMRSRRARTKQVVS